MKILEPTIEIPTIEVKIDKDIDEPVENIVRHWGPRYPVVSVNNITVPLGKVLSYSLSIGINKLPSFTLTISDDNGEFKNTLDDTELDTCVIFIGEQKWYRKYQGVILNAYSSGTTTNLSGILYNPKFYENPQQSFKDKSVRDVLIDMCKSMGMGLFLFETNNSDIEKIFSSINPGIRRLNYLFQYITKYTNNIFCIDDNYFLHIGDIESMKSGEVDMYTIKNGKFFNEPKPIIITNLLYHDVEDENLPTYETYHLVYNNITVDKNLGSTNVKYSEKYLLNNVELKTIQTGIGESHANTFKHFTDRYNPFYKERLEKDMSGKTIDITMQDNLLEISPFQVVDLRIYKDDEIDAEGNSVLDEKHSGKKIIIAYNESYSFESESENKYIQNITVI